MDIRVIIDADYGEPGTVPLDSIVNEIQIAEIPRKILQAVVTALQDRLINNMCGEKYSRDNQRFNFERCGKRDTRTFITELGTIKIKACKVRNRHSGEISTPIVLMVLRLKRILTYWIKRFVLPEPTSPTTTAFADSS